MQNIFDNAISKRILKKIVLSKPINKAVTKSVAKLITMKDELYLQIETFHTDGKATQKNIKASDAPEALVLMVGHEYKQMNVITTAGECQIKVSGKGKVTVLDRIKDKGEAVRVTGHDRKKQHIIPVNEPVDFLYELGVKDKDGRVFDKKRSKFRQINRFLELLSEAASFDKSKELYVLDLCCGKSYLSFAVYYYFTELLGIKVRMDCVDLKTDVIEYCSSVAGKLGYDGLHFIAGDINDFEPARTPDLTVSLHACDIATDIVLAKAVSSGSTVILSTPCCHHEMMHQIKPSGSVCDFMLTHSILKQKFCDAATDSLRCLMLEAMGYDVMALELIDPEETPKNVLIRANKNPKLTDSQKAQKLAQYNEICSILGIKPYLRELGM
ncbi:MAG: SAM-dependent methyltransferase [Ruminococcaceae bacterium]|nr:SAM-dependent methyltransferase [Oscillospiraceae bacterium]